MYSIVRLLGSRSLPWLIRALLDHLSNKVYLYYIRHNLTFDDIASKYVSKTLFKYITTDSCKKVYSSLIFQFDKIV